DWPDRHSRVVKVNDTVAYYILVYWLLVNIAWSEVDYVIIPINVKDKFHWVLGVFDICKRILIVYDSFIAAGNNNAVHQLINKFSVVIPLFLQCLDFYGKQNGINSYIGKSISEPLKVQWLVTEVPQQKFGSLDCGFYVAIFAEYVSIGEFSIPNVNFNVEEHRRRFGALLWDYAGRKQELGAISDSKVTCRTARRRGGPPKKQRLRVRNK
uniref:Ubiquitin-like protease family profile domain-containing protein n=1 Tax=Nicotiana tabacum TaxID=4097 RepID=A0A1S3YRB3_TOBAC